MADALAATWGMTALRVGRFSPVDFFLLKDGRLVGVMEVKCRETLRQQYPSVFFAVRKWMPLTLISLGLDVPALYAIRFKDGVSCIRVARVDGRTAKMNGRMDRGAAHDLEPVIEVPIAEMQDCADAWARLQGA